MKKGLIKCLTTSLAVLILSTTIINAAQPTATVEKKPLARYNEAYNKAQNFYKEVEVTNKEGKKVKQKVETYSIVLPQDVLTIDKALQDYVAYSIIPQVKGKKAEDLVNPLFSMVGIPSELTKEKQKGVSEVTADYMDREQMTFILKDYYFMHKQERDLHEVKGYDFFKTISRAELEEGINLAGSIVDLTRLQFVLSPYTVSGGKEYAVQSTVPRFEENLKVNRNARIIIEPVEGNNILASAWTGLGRVVYRELYALYMEGFKEDYMEGIYGKTITGNPRATTGKLREDSVEMCFAEDFRIYITEKTKGKNPVIDKIVNADKDSFYKKETIYGNKNAEVIKYFDKVLKEKNYKVEQKRLDPEVKFHIKEQDGYINYYGNEASAMQLDRIYTTSDELVITADDTNTLTKIASIGTIRGIEEFTGVMKFPESKKVAKNKAGEYRIKLQPGKTIVEIKIKTTTVGVLSEYIEVTR